MCIFSNLIFKFLFARVIRENPELKLEKMSMSWQSTTIRVI